MEAVGRDEPVEGREREWAGQIGDERLEAYSREPRSDLRLVSGERASVAVDGHDPPARAEQLRES
jgi:hypothetical protein